jgi:hypothetical protein
MKNAGNVGIGRAVQGPRAVRTDAENSGEYSKYGKYGKNRGRADVAMRAPSSNTRATSKGAISVQSALRRKHRSVVRRKSAHCKDLARHACVAGVKSAHLR